MDARERRRDVPDLDDLLRGARIARRPGDRRRMGAAADRRRAVRDGDDREAGRLGRAREHDPRRAGRRRLVRAPRPQVVLLLSAVRHLPRAGAGARGPVLLRARARRGDGVPAAQGQARHALAAVVGGRVPRRRRPAARRGGPRRGDDHRDGHAHPAGLRDRQRARRCAAASPRRSGTPATAPPSARGWSSSRRWSTCSPTWRWSPRPPPRPRCGSRAPTTRTTRRCAASRPRSRSTGSASAPRRTRSRPWSAWAATATSRSRRCRGCCATRR